jgi:hypothetical protein
MLLALGVAAIFSAGQPPSYVSIARMYDPGRPQFLCELDLPGDRVIEQGSLSNLMQSEHFRHLTLEHLKSDKAQVTIPLGPAGEPLPVALRLISHARSSVYTIEATGADAGYVRAFLNALMSAAIDYVKTSEEVVSGDMLAALTDQVARLEREIMAEENFRLDSERTNKPAVLRAQSAAAGECVEQFTVRLAELELEKRFLKCSGSQQDSSQTRALDQRIAATKDSIQEWENRLQENTELMSRLDGWRRNTDRARVPYERLVSMLQDATIRRNLSRATLRVLEPASPPERSYTAARHLFTVAGVSGFGLGVGIMLFIGAYRVFRRKNRSNEHTAPG